ncbi:MAG TPA: hypothetical protein VN923_09345 [Thermoanaerobaculia bacterium]|nr:hypothetical protein [Thermoanaerobaculia bacterium]
MAATLAAAAHAQCGSPRQLPTGTTLKPSCPCPPAPKVPVALRTSEAGDGWRLYFQLWPCAAYTDLLVGLDDAKPASTGHEHELDVMTGKPRVVDGIFVPPDQATPTVHRLVVKLVRPDGGVDGPYTLRFSPVEERLAYAKRLLAGSPRTFASFAEHGSVYTWLFFSTLFDLRHSIREVRYSIDDCALGKRILFSSNLAEEPKAERSVEHADDLTFERPFLTFRRPGPHSACVQAVFADGTTSNVLELQRSEKDRRPPED